MFPKKREKTIFFALMAEVNKVDHADVSMKLNIYISCEYMLKTFIKANYLCLESSNKETKPKKRKRRRSGERTHEIEG